MRLHRWLKPAYNSWQSFAHQLWGIRFVSYRLFSPRTCRIYQEFIISDCTQPPPSSKYNNITLYIRGVSQISSRESTVHCPGNLQDSQRFPCEEQPHVFALTNNLRLPFLSIPETCTDPGLYPAPCSSCLGNMRYEDHRSRLDPQTPDLFINWIEFISIIELGSEYLNATCFLVHAATVS